MYSYGTPSSSSAQRTPGAELCGQLYKRMLISPPPVWCGTRYYVRWRPFIAPRSLDNPQPAMSVKPPTTPMLGVTAQVAAIDGLRLGPRQGTQVQAQVQSAHSDAALIDAIRRGDAGSREALYHRFKRR